MSTIEQTSKPEAEILKKYPESRFIEASYKDIQRATLSELELLKKKYENWVKHHEESVTENRTTMFSDLLSEVEARRKALPAPETRAVKVQRLKKAIEWRKWGAAPVDVWMILRKHREKSKDVKTPIAIDLSPDIRDDPFWNSLEAYMFKFALQDGKYFLCVQEKGDPKAICVVEFNQEEYDRRISKEVPVKDRVGKTYGIWEEIRIGI